MRALLALAVVLLSRAAFAASPAFVDYLYIEANEGGSSGGHTAIRFGNETYHFQHERPGLLRLHRDDSRHFLYAYGGLENRTIHVSRIAVSDATYTQLRHRFGERWLSERKLFAQRDALRDNGALLELLLARREGDTQGGIGLRGAGFFFPDDRRSPPSRHAVALRRRVESTLGPDGIQRRIAALQGELSRLTPDSPGSPEEEINRDGYPRFPYPFSTRYRDLLTGMAALHAVDRALPLRPESRWAPADVALELDAAEARTLSAFADRLTGDLVGLLLSERPDWGFAFLVGMARLETLRESVETGRLVLLDAFSPGDSAVPRSYIDRHRDAVAHLRADARDDFARARARLRATDGIGERDLAKLEAAGNRLLELDRAATEAGDVRLWSAALLPSLEAPWSALVVPDVPTEDLVSGLAWARAAERRFSDRLARAFRYDLFTRNCVSEIFRTVDTAGTQPGVPLDPRWSLDFIPFVAARAVDETWDVVAQTTLPSYRRARLQGMYRHEGALRAWLRECNVVTSTIYRRNADDSFFVLFTDDVAVLRPVFGVVNLAAGLGAGAVGLALLPVDGGHTLMAGLRGALFSVPELAFVNLRKGSFDYVPQAAVPDGADVERRILIPVPSATSSNRVPNLSSLSRIRKRGPSPHAVASRSCWVTHALDGERVTPACTMRRDPSSIRKNAKIGRKSRS